MDSRNRVKPGTRPSDCRLGAAACCAGVVSPCAVIAFASLRANSALHVTRAHFQEAGPGTLGKRPPQNDTSSEHSISRTLVNALNENPSPFSTWAGITSKARQARLWTPVRHRRLVGGVNGLGGGAARGRPSLPVMLQVAVDVEADQDRQHEDDHSVEPVEDIT